MSRISAHPTKDAEAWQALITEAQSCYRTVLPSLHKLKNSNIMGRDVDDLQREEVELLEKKLDWIESCYGALLHHFPFAVSHYVQLAEIFLRLSAVTPDEEEQCGATFGGGGMMMTMAMMGGSTAAASSGGGGGA